MQPTKVVQELQIPYQILKFCWNGWKWFQKFFCKDKWSCNNFCSNVDENGFIWCLIFCDDSTVYVVINFKYLSTKLYCEFQYFEFNKKIDIWKPANNAYSSTSLISDFHFLDISHYLLSIVFKFVYKQHSSVCQPLFN